jgi:Flp pilus assembly protein TadB
MFSAIVAGAIGISTAFCLLVFVMLVTSHPLVAAFYGVIAGVLLVNVLFKMGRTPRSPK